MKNFLILLSFMFSLQVLAQQTGISTKNPQGPLHVDVSKNNNANASPTVAQQEDDFIVTIDGFVGIGTTIPTHKLDIRGKIQIKDGGERIGGVLTTDANGLAVWIIPAANRPLVRGVFPPNSATLPARIASTGGTALLNTGVTITLSRGKWIVNAGITFVDGGVTIFQRNYLSSANNALQQNGFTFLGPAGAQTSYGGLLVANVRTSSISIAQRGFVAGSTLIEVTQPSVTLYLLSENKPIGSYVCVRDAWENYFYARPID